MYSKEERTTLIGLGLPTMFLRFGKALVILIFILYALTFTDSYFLIGIAFGVTALVQAVLTVPFGFWSDRFGRKKMIIIGLVFFIIGSFLAAHPFDNIFILIFARFLQGAGAIYSCVLAFIGDVIPDKKRSRTLAYFSIMTGIVFSVGIILGPTISPMFMDYEFLFFLSGIMGIVALIYLVIYVEEPVKRQQIKKKDSNHYLFKDVLSNNNLTRTYISTFFSNFILVSILLILVPIMLEDYIPTEFSGLLLIPIFVVGMAIMLYTSKLADKGNRQSIAIMGFCLAAVGIILFFIANLYIIIIGLLIFFTGMAILDPILPSFIIEIASKKAKGTASGFYNVSRYLGESIGAIVAGILLTFKVTYLLTLLVTLGFISIILINSLKISVKKETV